MWGDCQKAELLAGECPYFLGFLPLLPVPQLFFSVVLLPIHPILSYLSKEKAEQTENQPLWGGIPPRTDVTGRPVTSNLGETGNYKTKLTCQEHKSMARASMEGVTSTLRGTVLEAQRGRA